jgi:hypothetical protein
MATPVTFPDPTGSYRQLNELENLQLDQQIDHDNCPYEK